jgi:cell division septation protein DedD
MSTVVDPDTNEHAVAGNNSDAAPAVEPLACPNCGAPADPGQLMCLECGSRLALGYQRTPSWRLPAAVIGVVVLLAGIGLAIALAAATGGSTTTVTAASTPTQPATTAPQSAPADSAPTASQPTPAPPAAATTATAAPAGSGTGGSSTATPTPATSASSGWPPGKSGFTVILASLPSKAAADAKLNDAKAAGISGAAVLHSDDFPTLRPGYWVVFDGQYDAVGQAQTQATADRAKAGFSDAYPRFVSKDAGAKP